MLIIRINIMTNVKMKPVALDIVEMRHAMYLICIWTQTSLSQRELASVVRAFCKCHDQ